MNSEYAAIGKLSASRNQGAPSTSCCHPDEVMIVSRQAKWEVLEMTQFTTPARPPTNGIFPQPYRRKRRLANSSATSFLHPFVHRLLAALPHPGGFVQVIPPAQPNRRA